MEIECKDDDFFIEKPKIEGITEKIVDNLHDIVDKFGTFDVNENITRFASGDIGLGFELYLSTSLDGKRMLVTKFSSKISLGGLEIIKTIIGDIFWDKCLTPKECNAAIKNIYEVGRMVTFKDFKPGKYVVDDIFSSPGIGFMVPPGKDPQEILNQFDQPEKLTVIKSLYGYVVQHIDHLSYTERRSKIVMQILNEKGIDLNDIGKIGFDDIIKMREEIQKRMEE